MLNITTDKVHVILSPTDMRKSFDTLAVLVKNHGMDPLNGELYVFTNKSKNRFKILLWENGGFWVCAKRLEEGIFAVPLVRNKNSEHYVMRINLTELRLLIEGIELRKIKKNKRYMP